MGVELQQLRYQVDSILRHEVVEPFLQGFDLDGFDGVYHGGGQLTLQRAYVLFRRTACEHENPLELIEG